ncbi:MAG: hypothetical protein JWP80_3006 [Pseudomonas sp.]|nr:hypothetical protein [Pseudomonas sp.]
MQSPVHSLPSLFQQLGLDADPTGIEAFVSSHSPLKGNVVLSDARFWTKAQADFIREETLGDADWAEVIDLLNLMLRKKG